jgi:hypothetical protein
MQLTTLKQSRQGQRSAIQTTPLEAFATTRRLSAAETRRFLRYVEHAGGSFWTDQATLALLFELWVGKGRP